MNKSIQGNANGIVEQAKQTVANVASDAKAGVTTQLEQRIDQAKGIGVEKIETISEALRGAGEKLDGTGPLPQLAERAAEGIENLADYIENKTVGDVFRGVESFARREPALFLGGAAMLGVLIGRFLKSSAHRDVASGPGMGRYSYAGGDIGTDRFETFGYEGDYGEYGSEDDYLSADDLEDDWDMARQPLAFESEGRGIGTAATDPTMPMPSAGSSTGDARTTQPQGSSAGAVGVGASTRGATEKMPATQGSVGLSGTPEDTSGDSIANKSNR